MRKIAPTNWPRLISVYSDVGLRFALAIAIGGYGGYWLDAKLAISPIALLVGILLGATAGFISLYRTVMKTEAPNEPAAVNPGRKGSAQKN